MPNEKSSKRPAGRKDLISVQLRQGARSTPRQLVFLAEVSTALAKTQLDVEATVQAIASLAVPAFGEYCVVEVHDERRGQRVVHASHVQPEKTPLTRELLRFRLDFGLRATLLAKVSHTRKPEIAWEIPQAMLELEATDARHLEILQTLAPNSFIMIPLLSGGRMIGSVSAYRASGAYAPGDASLAGQFGSQAGLALENALRHQQAMDSCVRAKENVGLLERVLMDAPVGLAVVDADLRFVQVNRAFGEIDRLDPDFHIGVRIDQLEGLGSRLAEGCRQAIAGGTPLLEQEITVRETAIDRFFIVSYYPIGSPENPVAVGMALREHTRRKQMETGLRFLAEAGRILADSLDHHETLGRIARSCLPQLGDCCVIDTIDPAGVVSRPAIAHLSPEKELLVREVTRKYPIDLHAPFGPGRAIRTGEPEIWSDNSLQELPPNGNYASQAEQLRRLGVRGYLAVPLKARGRVLGCITLSHNQAQREYGEQDIALVGELAKIAALSLDNAYLYAQAQSSLKAREELLQMVSHDLKNPLIVVLMRAAVLQRKAGSDETGQKMRSQAEAIQRAAEQMNRLIHDLLDLARLEAGVFALEKRPVELGSLVRESVRMLLPIAQKKSITLTRTRLEVVCMVECDRERMLQVFSNLIGNALKFTPQGGKVRVLLHPLEGGREVRVSVCDTGPGIEPDNVSKVFDRFWTARPADRTGAGLGLGIVRGIVEAHGGRIWLESRRRLGEGCNFHFTLPLSTA